MALRTKLRGGQLSHRYRTLGLGVRLCDQLVVPALCRVTAGRHASWGPCITTPTYLLPAPIGAIRKALCAPAFPLAGRLKRHFVGARPLGCPVRPLAGSWWPRGWALPRAAQRRDHPAR